MPEEDRRRLQAWVRDKLAPRQVTRPRSSYALKHTAEKDLGFYVSNAELKGAMLEAGYEPLWDNRINMGFRCGPRPARRMLFWHGGWQRGRELPMEAFEFDRVFGADLTCD